MDTIGTITLTIIERGNNILNNSSKKIKENKRKKTVIFILTVLLLAVAGITVWALFFRNTMPVLAPDYAPQETEKNAEPIVGDISGDKLVQSQNSGAISLTYSKEVTIDLSDKTASLLFANPHKSNQDMMIQIIIRDKVILQSGLLPPGNQVKKMKIFDNAKLSAGVHEGKLVVLYYQKDTGEKAAINTEIPLTVTIEE